MSTTQRVAEYMNKSLRWYPNDKRGRSPLVYRAQFMSGSRNFRQGVGGGGWGGGGPGQSDKKKLCLFLVLSLFYRSQMVNFEEIYHFSRFQSGSNIIQVGPTFSRGVGGGGVGGPIVYSL